MEFYGATYFPVSKMLISRFWKIDQKIRGRAEFYGATHNSARSRVFQCVLKDFVKCKMNCQNQPQYITKLSCFLLNAWNFIFIKFYGFWKIRPKTHVRAEFLGAAHSYGLLHVFRSIFKDFGKWKNILPKREIIRLPL